MSNLIGSLLLPEFDHEMETTRKILEVVPMDKADWVPHEKSTPLGKLAKHVASLPNFVVTIMTQDSFKMSAYNPPAITTTAELLEAFDKNAKAAHDALAAGDDEKFQEKWSFYVGDKLLSESPRGSAVQGFMMNHLIHHRAQLGVYLRLNDIAIPGSYGPSADTH